MVWVLLTLFLICVLGFTVLLFITPSVGNAPALARAFDRVHHVAYPGPPVPARFAEALIETEDHRFYYEPGIDPFGVARFLLGKITGNPDQGGATLYQQLAKMLYSPGKTGLLVQAEQATMGIKLDFAFPKATILQMYADVTYFGHGYYGLAAASCGYFGVTPARLDWTESAMLAGLVQAPSADDPITHYQNARARESLVLGRLVATGKLTQQQANQVFREPLHLVGGPPNACAG